ncbi:MAG: membrane protein insertase YidC [Candidatus Liptonbacteria bacterium]|nr:membrane protein insertase YidC [Candidatus Liptonbacteria bacterium]
MANLYHLVLYQPLLNLLVILYQTTAGGDLGVAIIELTVLIQLILFPIVRRNLRTQMVMQKIQPELRRTQELYKKDPAKQYQAMMATYREHHISPFGGFALTFVQLLLIIPLYQIFLHIFAAETLTQLYSFVSQPAALANISLGLINLPQPSILLVVLTAAMQLLQGWLMFQPLAGSGPGPASSKMMILMGPVITVVIFSRLPAAVGLYWLASTIASIGQTVIIRRQLTTSHDQPRSLCSKTDSPDGV